MNMHAKLRKPLTIIKIGNSHGVILPKDVLAKLGVEPGDTLDVVDQTDGIHLLRHDEGFASQMGAAREVMKRRRSALRELAK